MSTPARLERMKAVLAQRLGHVHVALEAVYHRHNVSAVLRSCDAFGLHHVHLVRDGEQFEPIHGAARGAERWLAIQLHDDAEAAIGWLKTRGIRLYVADLQGDAVAPEAVPLDQPVCLWFGTELTGVSERARAAADGVVQVPMHGFVQSLNVSVAAAVAIRPVAERARALGSAALLSQEEADSIWTKWEEDERTLRHAIRSR